MAITITQDQLIQLAIFTRDFTRVLNQAYKEGLALQKQGKRVGQAHFADRFRRYTTVSGGQQPEFVDQWMQTFKRWAFLELDDLYNNHDQLAAISKMVSYLRWLNTFAKNWYRNQAKPVKEPIQEKENQGVAPVFQLVRHAYGVASEYQRIVESDFRKKPEFRNKLDVASWVRGYTTSFSDTLEYLKERIEDHSPENRLADGLDLFITVLRNMSKTYPDGAWVQRYKSVMKNLINLLLEIDHAYTYI